jgi:hypothetical protein
VPAFCREAARGLGGNPHPALRAIALRPCSASESGEAHDVRAYAAALADGLAGVPDPEEACLQICVRTKNLSVHKRTFGSRRVEPTTLDPPHSPDCPPIAPSAYRKSVRLLVDAASECGRPNIK